MNRREFIKAGGAAAGGTGITLNTLTNRSLTIRMWMNPEKFLEPEATEEIDDINEWTEEEYHYSKDPFFGLYDTTKPVEQFIKDKTGDCDDYARFALSYFKRKDISAYLVLVLTDSFGLHMFVHDNYFAYDYHGVEDVRDKKERALIWKEKKID